MAELTDDSLKKAWVTDLHIADNRLILADNCSKSVNYYELDF